MIKHSVIIILGCIPLIASIPEVNSEMFNYSRSWKSLPIVAQDAYSDGFVDGYFHAYIVAAKAWLPPDKIFEKPQPELVSKVTQRIFIFVDKKVIREVMTDLYNDPANAYIGTPDMLYIARDKIMGEDINDRLIKARKKAFEHHQIMKNVE